MRQYPPKKIPVMLRLSEDTVAQVKAWGVRNGTDRLAVAARELVLLALSGERGDRTGLTPRKTPVDKAEVARRTLALAVSKPEVKCRHRGREYDALEQMWVCGECGAQIEAETSA